MSSALSGTSVEGIFPSVPPFTLSLPGEHLCPSLKGTVESTPGKCLQIRSETTVVLTQCTVNAQGDYGPSVTGHFQEQADKNICQEQCNYS